MLVVCATLASLFPFVGHDRLPDRAPAGVPRRRAPARAGDDRRRGAARELDYQLCPHCDYEVKADYLRCPSCMRKLKERCYSCGKPIDPAWRMCPFCEAETSAPHRRPRRAAAGRQTTDQPTVAAEAAPSAEPRAGEPRDGRDVAPQTTLTHCPPWNGH